MNNEYLTILGPEKVEDSVTRPTRSEYGDLWKMGDHLLSVRKFSAESMVWAGFRGVCNVVTEHNVPDIFPFAEVRSIPNIRSMSVYCDVKTMALFFLEYGIAIENVICRKRPLQPGENYEEYLPDISYLLWIPMRTDEDDKREFIVNRDRQPYADRSQILRTFDTSVQGMMSTLPRRILSNQILLVSEIGDIILNPQAQNSDVLISCVEYQRKCWMFQQDREIADSILQDYEELTGEEAARV